MTLQTYFNITVNQGSIGELKTTGGEQRGANGAAEDGSNTVSIMNSYTKKQWEKMLTLLLWWSASSSSVIISPWLHPGTHNTELSVKGL